MVQVYHLEIINSTKYPKNEKRNRNNYEIILKTAAK
jgi:hypothetical protein